MGHPQSASRLSGCKDCEAARPDPCCRLGGGQCGGAHGVSMAISEGQQVDSALVSMVPMAQGWLGSTEPVGSCRESWVRFRALVWQDLYEWLDETEAFGTSRIKSTYAVQAP